MAAGPASAPVDGGWRLFRLMVGGVQPFIAQSRATADLWGASSIVSRLMTVAANRVSDRDGRLILPPADVVAGGGDRGNHLLAAVPESWSSDHAVGVVDEVGDAWRGLADSVGVSLREVDRGFPSTAWVLSDPSEDLDDTYPQRFEQVAEGVGARKRVRRFAALPGVGGGVTGVWLCPLCGARFALDSDSRPRRASRYDRDRLCGVCWVKRLYRFDPAGEGVERFPSTADVASSPYRERVARLWQGGGEGRAAVDRLLEAWKQLRAQAPGWGGQVSRGTEDRIPQWVRWAADVDDERLLAALDGSWLYADSWAADSMVRDTGPPGLSDHQVASHAATIASLAAAGRQAALALAAQLRAAQGSETPRLTSYLAVLVQDADGLGRALGRGPAGRALSAGWHRDVGEAMADAGGAQRGVVEEQGGRVVYAGGDDLMALLPTPAALPAAEGVRAAFTETLSGVVEGLTASTAVVWVHRSYPLQEALARAQRAVQEAKATDAAKNRLRVVVLRRGGERAAATLRWHPEEGRTARSELTGLVEAFAHGLSPAALFDLEGCWQLCAGRQPFGDAELRRIVLRHHRQGRADPAERIARLRPGRGVVAGADVASWLGAVHAAHFVHQETR